MKGIIIFEDANPTLKNVYCINLNNSDVTMNICPEAVYTLTGVREGMKTAACNKDDTYDFETGALIALMKMCGVEKVVRACNKAFSENTFKTYATKYERELNVLKKDSDKVIDELIEENEMLKNESTHRLRDKIDLKEKYVALMAENEKLKLDCEKLQHGYNDMVFCGGRQNGKQHTLLVELFKKIDQKKVDAAYKEAYDKWIAQPIWQKEVFKQIHKDQLASLLEAGKYLYKNPTKREEMWEKVFTLHKESDVIIKVKREDVNAFLHEIENRIPEITWLSTVKIFETKYTITDIYDELKIRDEVYFRLSKETTLSYSIDKFTYAFTGLKSIDYLPPMRWDLFKKGRKIVRITPENLDDFMTKCSNNLGCIIKPAYKYDTHVFIMISDYHYDNKPTLHIMSPEDLVRNQYENPKKYSDKKIVDWEDVR